MIESDCEKLLHLPSKLWLFALSLNQIKQFVVWRQQPRSLSSTSGWEGEWWSVNRCVMTQDTDKNISWLNTHCSLYNTSNTSSLNISSDPCSTLLLLHWWWLILTEANNICIIYATLFTKSQSTDCILLLTNWNIFVWNNFWAVSMAVETECDASSSGASETDQQDPALAAFSLVKFENPEIVDTDDTAPSSGDHDTDAGDQEVLNSILPPREWEYDGKLWRQSVSASPATRLDVMNLQEQLDQKLQQRQARETGICQVSKQILFCFYFLS